jgi:iron complex transport system substrate-binding protein
MDPSHVRLHESYDERFMTPGVVNRCLPSVLWLAWVLIVSVVTLGCSESTRKESSPANQVAPHQTSRVAGFPAEVQDARGVRCVLPTRPKRIVSLSPQNTELLFAVGAGEQVVGVTSYCNYPPEAAHRTIVGGFASNSINLEVILSLQPDLIVAGRAIHAPVVKRLEAFGISVICLEADQLDDLFDDLRLVGRATGQVERAEQVVSDLQAKVEQVSQVVHLIPESERRMVFYEVWDDPLGAAGPNSFIGRMIAICGGRNMIDDPEARYPLISHELVLTLDPDVILIPTAHANEFQLDDVVKRPGWGQLQAVKERRVYRLDGDLVSRFTPRFFDALPQIAQLIYPEYFPSDQPAPSKTGK